MSPVAKISPVLVGVDFDEASASALQMAGVLASTLDADVTVGDCGYDRPLQSRPVPRVPADVTAISPSRVGRLRR